MRALRTSMEEGIEEWGGDVIDSGRATTGQWTQTGRREFLVTPNLMMWIREENFDLPEFLEWVKVFLTEFMGHPEPKLAEAEFEEFERSNQHARNIGEIAEKLEGELG
ncbi:hypothetical protein ACFL3S_02835 [Gemmatimonadota bacterium]